VPSAYSLFILPPSDGALMERLRARKRDDEAAMQRRYAAAREEIRQARESGIYDHFIVNDSLERAIAEALEIVTRERDRRRAARS
jgi:guanylate kinase